MPLICPHCGWDNAKAQEPSGLPWEDDTRADVACHLCGKTYIVNAVSRITWETFASEDDYINR